MAHYGRKIDYIKAFIKNEFLGWKKWEVRWLVKRLIAEYLKIDTKW